MILQWFKPQQATTRHFRAHKRWSINIYWMTDGLVMLSLYMKNMEPPYPEGPVISGFPVHCRSAFVWVPVLGKALLLALWWDRHEIWWPSKVLQSGGGAKGLEGRVRKNLSQGMKARVSLLELLSGVKWGLMYLKDLGGMLRSREY